MQMLPEPATSPLHTDQHPRTARDRPPPTVPHSLITARLSRSTAGEHVRPRGGQKEVRGRLQHEEKTKEKTSSQRES